MLPADVTCFRCKHFKKDAPKWSCAAFPDGIPKNIIYGKPPKKCSKTHAFAEVKTKK